MELIVLGAGGTWPNPGGATSGYLIQHEGFTLWVDAGTGTMARLLEHISLLDVDALLITHGHPDHFVDLYPYFYAVHYGGQGRRDVPLYAPPGFMDIACGLMGRDTAEAMRQTLEVKATDWEQSYEVGPFRVDTRPMEHFGIAQGFRISTDGAVLAYTGDSGPTNAIPELARDADVLLSEATWQDGPDVLPFHLSARQAGEHATRASANRLLLTHIWPSLDKKISREQAAEAFSGEIELAVEGMQTKVGK